MKYWISFLAGLGAVFIVIFITLLISLGTSEENAIGIGYSIQALIIGYMVTDKCCKSIK